MLFAIPSAMAVPIIAAILVGGPIVGFPVAALVALVIVAVAISMRPRRLAAQAPRVAANPDWRVAAVRRFAVSAAIAVAGIVMIAATGGTAEIIGWGVLAVALTLVVSLAFLEIGYSADRARAAERRRAARIPPHGRGAHHAR